MGQRQHGLIPPSAAVREELARNYEQARLLRRLLKLSEDAVVENHSRNSEERHHEPGGVQPEGAAP
jgi:hypothetical protein